MAMAPAGVELIELRGKPAQSSASSGGSKSLTAYEHVNFFHTVLKKTLSCPAFAGGVAMTTGLVVMLSALAYGGTQLMPYCENPAGNVDSIASAANCTVNWGSPDALCSPTFTLTGCSENLAAFQQAANTEINAANTQAATAIASAGIAGAVVGAGAFLLYVGHRVYRAAYQDPLAHNTSLAEPLLAV